MNVPSSLVRDRILNPVLDARAENLRQARLIANASPEVDSIVEHVREIARNATPGQRGHLGALLLLVRDLAQSNAAEGNREAGVAGVVDQLASDLRRHETSTPLGMGAQDLARRLRGPLGILANPRAAGGTKYVAAVRAIEDVLAVVPSCHLLDNVTLRHELGVRKYSGLCDLIRERVAA